MKIRVRDQKLPLKGKTAKFRPLRKKNTILKIAVSLLFILNITQTIYILNNL